MLVLCRFDRRPGNLGSAWSPVKVFEVQTYERRRNYSERNPGFIPAVWGLRYHSRLPNTLPTKKSQTPLRLATQNFQVGFLAGFVFGSFPLLER
jgi:hypothetical protein